MVCKCIVCGAETIKAGAVNQVTRGVCPTGVCERVWNDWMDMPSPKPELKLYYLALTAGNIDRAQLCKLGGKGP